jgi:hypothetical protein
MMMAFIDAHGEDWHNGGEMHRGRVDASHGADGRPVWKENDQHSQQPEGAMSTGQGQSHVPRQPVKDLWVVDFTYMHTLGGSRRRLRD